MNINWNIVEGKWKEVKGSVIERWGMLTDDELEQVGGKREKLEGLIQQKYGITQVEAEKQIDDWAEMAKDKTFLLWQNPLLATPVRWC
jgi:uncharacterized protein YjbJ (UPF0337 family)